MTDTGASAGMVRRYRFAPLDRSGWLLGLGGPQCVALGAGLVLSGLALRAGVSIVVAAIPMALAGGFAFARLGGRALHEWVPVLTGWIGLRWRHEDRWFVPLDVLGGPSDHAVLPPFLAGLVLLDVPAGGRGRLGGVGVVHDQAQRCYSGVLRVAGHEFTLLDSGDQERLLGGWGSALGGFAKERPQVVQVTWSEWAAPAGLDEHLAYLDGHLPSDRGQRDDVAGEALESYLELLRDAGPLTTRHDVLITVTVDARRVHLRDSHRRGRGVGPDRGVIEVLLDELRLFTTRLTHAGLGVSGPLTAAEVAYALRTRTDPACAAGLAAGARSLGEQLGLVAPSSAGPLSVQVDWDRLRVDGAWHRCYWIAGWPRLEMPADWLAGLVLHPGGVRTLSVALAPVPPSRSQRHIDRDATRLVADEDQRTRRGFRVGAKHRRAQSEVLEREAELVAGYAELHYRGFLTLTAATSDQLDALCGEYEQVAAQAGLELRALDGQHDLGLGAGLPVGRYPTRTRMP